MKFSDDEIWDSIADDISFQPARPRAERSGRYGYDATHEELIRIEKNLKNRHKYRTDNDYRDRKGATQRIWYRRPGNKEKSNAYNQRWKSENPKKCIGYTKRYRASERGQKTICGVYKKRRLRLKAQGLCADCAVRAVAHKRGRPITRCDLCNQRANQTRRKRKMK